MIRGAIKLVLYTAALGFGGLLAWGVCRPAVEGSGVSKTEERVLDDFTEIAFSGTGELTVMHGSVPSVSVTADDNILPLLVTETSNRKLNIRGASSFSAHPKTKITYVVTVPSLNAITVSGAGTVRAEQLVCGTLTVKISGAGNAQLRGLACKQLNMALSGAGTAHMSGVAEKATLRLSGAGDIDAGELRTASADVQISGAGNATVWATSDLKARVSGAGGIKYKGSPRVEQKVSGAGRIRSLE